MLDLLFLLVIGGAFALFAALIVACNRPVHDDQPIAVPVEADSTREEVRV